MLNVWRFNRKRSRLYTLSFLTINYFHYFTKTMDIIETIFLKEGCIGHASVGKRNSTALTVRQTASAAAAGLRMLDGVRMLGPSLAKLCNMPAGDGTEVQPSIAAILCIAMIHRPPVKNTARTTLENLAEAIPEDPVKGCAQRVKDARHLRRCPCCSRCGYL
jgi:exocyst complex protein 7